MKVREVRADELHSGMTLVKEQPPRLPKRKPGESEYDYAGRILEVAALAKPSHKVVDKVRKVENSACSKRGTHVNDKWCYEPASLVLVKA